MISSPMHPSTLAEAVWPAQSMPRNLVRNVLLAVLGSALLFLSAKVNIPFKPIPITMQTFVVLAIGMVYGWKLGGATVLLYLLEGAFGLPVFANTPERGLGLAYMMGPSGGYLLGFLVAAVACGWLAERGWDRRVVTTFAAMVIGNAIIYLFGIGWLGSVIGWDKPVFELGMFPFIPGDIAKIVLAMCVLPAAWKAVKR